MSDPITVVQLDNAGVDAETFSEFLNSLQAIDLVSRLGAVYPTLVKAIRSIGFSEINVWASGTHSDFQILVTNGGQTYRLAEVHTSSGVFATDLAAGKWLIWAGNNIQTDFLDQTVNALLVVGAFGWGRDVGIELPGSDADALTIAASFKTPATWTGSPYSGTMSKNQGTLLHQNAFVSDTFATQIFLRMQDDEMWIRHKNAGVWSTFKQVWHEGNMSNGVFSPGADDRRLMSDTAYLPTLVDFYVPINFVVNPVARSLTGTFELIKKDGTSVATGLDATDITIITSASSPRLALIRVANVTVVAGTDYVLMTESASSEIIIS